MTRPRPPRPLIEVRRIAVGDVFARVSTIRGAEGADFVLVGPVVAPELRRIAPLAWGFLRSSWHEPFQVKVLALGAYLVCGFRWFFKVLPEMMRNRPEAALPGIRCDVLVIRGEHDHASPLRWCQRVAATVPRGTLWEIGGAGHSVMYAHADGVARLIADAVRERPAPTGGAVHRMASERAETRTQQYRSLGAWLRGMRGRAREAAGAVTGDERLVASGKDEHARAAAEQPGEGR